MAENKKMRKITIIVAVVLLIFVVGYRVKKGGSDSLNESNVYKNEEFGFEFTYPQKIKSKKYNVTVFGSGDDKLFSIQFFRGEKIHEVIETFKREEVKEGRSSVTSERDVRLNNCTARLIVVADEQGIAHNYHFISREASTYQITWENLSTPEDQKFLSETIKSFHCAT